MLLVISSWMCSFPSCIKPGKGVSSASKASSAFFQCFCDFRFISIEEWGNWPSSRAITEHKVMAQQGLGSTPKTMARQDVTSAHSSLALGCSLSKLLRGICPPNSLKGIRTLLGASTDMTMALSREISWVYSWQRVQYGLGHHVMLWTNWGPTGGLVQQVTGLFPQDLMFQSWDRLRIIISY